MALTMLPMPAFAVEGESDGTTGMEIYAVTYDANGGTGPAPPESGKAAGEVFTAAENTFTAPEGKQFAVWNTASDVTGAVYAPGTEITMPENDLTLYAVWEDMTPMLPSMSALAEGDISTDDYEFIAETGTLTIKTNEGTASWKDGGISSDDVSAVIIENSVTAIGDNAFYGCWALTSVTIPNGVTAIGNNAFYHCASLTSVTIPNGVTTIGNSAFGWCSSLVSLTIPGSVNSMGDDAFPQCWSLTSVTIEEGVASIGYGAFYCCESLASVTLPESLESIGGSAFNNCTSLTSVTIPGSVTSIGGWAFYECMNLATVYFEHSDGAPILGGQVFYYFDYDDDIWEYLPLPGVTIYYYSTASGFGDGQWTEYNRHVLLTREVADAAEFETALNLSESGDTIKLTDHITYTNPITLDGKTLTIDTGGYTLDIEITPASQWASAVHLSEGAVLDHTGDGEINVSMSGEGLSGNYSQTKALFVDSRASAEVTSVSTGVSGAFAIYAANSSTVVNIEGNVSADVGNAVAIYADSGATVCVEGAVSAFTSISLNWVNYPLENGALSTTEGYTSYFEYTDGTNTVYIKGYTLTTSAGTGGSVSSASGTYWAGKVIDLAATANANCKFDGWTSSGAGSFDDAASASAAFTMPAANVTVTADFAPKTAVSISETPQTAVYSGTAKAFAITGTPNTGFTVTYNQGDGDVTPVDVGTYNVVITRAEDEEYASYSKTIAGGLVIAQTISDEEITGLTPPVCGGMPDTTVNETDQYTATVTWEPSDSPFKASTVYTAIITLTPETGYTLTGVGSNFFTVAGATATNEADLGVITAVFPKTGAVSSGGGGPSSGSATTPTTESGLIPVEDLTTDRLQETFVIESGAAKVVIPSNMLSGVSGISGSNAEIKITEGDKSDLPDDISDKIGDRPLIQITLEVDGKQTDWSNPNAPVTISISYTPTAEELQNPESIVVWYIDGSGNAVTIPNGHYDPATGMVTFDTTHFSDYAVAYNKVSFNDVAASAWYNKAVSFIAAREITTGTGNGNYSPEAKLTRGEFIVLMMRAYGIAPDASPTNNFSDAGNTYYTGYLAAARRLGITAGVGNNVYAPGKEITRQEMFTLLYNALKVIGKLPTGDSGKTVFDFSDTTQIDSWAQEAMATFVVTGTVGGSNGQLTPTGTTTRAEMAQVLYNLLGK